MTSVRGFGLMIVGIAWLALGTFFEVPEIQGAAILLFGISFLIDEISDLKTGEGESR